MAYIEDPILIPPKNRSEACLRIQESMRGAVAEGRVVTRELTQQQLDVMFDTGESPELLVYEFHQVDVTPFYDRRRKHPDGRLKGCGSYNDEASPLVAPSFITYEIGDEHRSGFLRRLWDWLIRA